MSDTRATRPRRPLSLWADYPDKAFEVRGANTRPVPTAEHKRRNEQQAQLLRAALRKFE